MPERPGRILAATLAAGSLAAGAAIAEPAVWAIDGGDNDVFLFGSVHLLQEGSFAVGGVLAEAVAQAERICLEIDPDAQDEAETLSLTLARAVDPEGRTLFDLLGEDAAEVRERAEEAGIDLAPFAAFEPWFAGLTVSLIALQQHGYDGAHGVEQVIRDAARTQGKPICALETLDEQLALLDSMPAASQRDLLLQSLDEADEVDALIRPLIAAWDDGDEEYLERRLASDIADYPDLADLLIFDRNARWADEVAEMLRGTENVLVVVGAMHLAGERGLPALLEQRGFRVERR